MTDNGHSPYAEGRYDDGPYGDGKAPDALRTIGEVARILGLKPHVLRYWEEHFPMLRPLTRAGNRRYYRAADVALLATIDRLLNREGYTVRGARQAIESGASVSFDRGGMAPPAPAVGEGGVMTQAVANPSAERHAVPGLEGELVAAIARLRVHLEAIRGNLAYALSDGPET